MVNGGRPHHKDCTQIFHSRLKQECCCCSSVRATGSIAVRLDQQPQHHTFNSSLLSWRSFLVCFFFCGSQSKRYSRVKVAGVTDVETMWKGAKLEAVCPRARPYKYEPNTKNTPKKPPATQATSTPVGTARISFFVNCVYYLLGKQQQH